ncbi:MAG: bifunctional folylpolyglutamate synthase/dihydrofolate synthase [Bacteroidia bacterium]|nr:bifunctional folylpolyglutamate synthase/dihydrofolate synthase [Bacteroidia bacterium]
MRYRETLLWLYSHLPMYQRIGAAAYKANLDNTIALCNLLGNPQNYFDSIHVAGTNGKGSVSHMLASICQEHGLKTGLYTSPHLKDFRERIRVNGRMIPKRKVTGFIKKYEEEFEQIQPSFFEMTVGLAFDYFREEEVDIAIVEVGMGGRLDSTNILTPLVSVITNISYDHKQFLGGTLEKIAIEKAGIIKPGIPVVIGETQEELEEIFRKQANKAHSSILFADQTQANRKKIRISNFEFRISLQGVYQQKNIRTSCAVTSLLNQKGLNISEQEIHDGILKVTENTGLQGRWQILNRTPLTICDIGHNEAGIREVVEQLNQTPHKHLHIVFGQVNDKEIETILALLPKEATYYFCKANIPRGLDADELKIQAESAGLTGKSYGSVRIALADARKEADPGDLIFIGGSTFVVAEALA